MIQQITHISLSLSLHPFDSSTLVHFPLSLSLLSFSSSPSLLSLSLSLYSDSEFFPSILDPDSTLGICSDSLSLSIFLFLPSISLSPLTPILVHLCKHDHDRERENERVIDNTSHKLPKNREREREKRRESLD